MKRVDNRTLRILEAGGFSYALNKLDRQLVLAYTEDDVSVKFPASWRIQLTVLEAPYTKKGGGDVFALPFLELMFSFSTGDVQMGSYFFSAADLWTLFFDYAA